MIKKIFVIAATTMLYIQAFSQTAADYKRRYDLLASKMGPAGVGIESILDKWAEADSMDVDMLKARHAYYFNKAQSEKIVVKDARKYMGNNPVLSLKDSLGQDVNYFHDIIFDDDCYSKAIKNIDKAVRLAPNRLDLCLDKATSLLTYEKESPDMALSYILSLVDMNKENNGNWEYPGVDLESGTFCQLMQDYCCEFFLIGSSSSWEAFKTLSEKMYSLYPSEVCFLSNIGSYYMAKEDLKNALKYFNKVLKIQPDDYSAIKNCVTIAVREKNTKLEKKYLPMLAEYGSESEKMSAKARLDALNSKK